VWGSCSVRGIDNAECVVTLTHGLDGSQHPRHDRISLSVMCLRPASSGQVRHSERKLKCQRTFWQTQHCIAPRTSPAETPASLFRLHSQACVQCSVSQAFRVSLGSRCNTCKPEHSKQLMSPGVGGAPNRHACGASPAMPRLCVAGLAVRGARQQQRQTCRAACGPTLSGLLLALAPVF